MRLSNFLVLVVLWLLSATVPRAHAQEEPPPQLRFLEGSQSSIRAVGYGAAGRTIVGANIKGKVFFWDSATGQLIGQLDGHAEPILSLAVSPDGYRLATGGRDRLVKTFDLPTIHPLASLTGFSGLPTSVAVSRDATLAVTGDQAKNVRVWNLKNNQNLFTFGMAEVVTDVDILGEHKLILASAADGSLSGWNTADGKVITTVLTAPSNAIAADPKATFVVAAGKDGVLRNIQWPPQAPRSLASLGGLVAATEISADGKFFLTGSHDQTVKLFDAETGEEVRALDGQPGQVFGAAISADGKLVATGSGTGFLKFWQTEDGADRGTLAGHTGPVRAVAFHPTLAQVTSAGEDGTVRMWQIPKPLPRFPGGDMPMLATTVSHDGKSIAAVGADQRLERWNLANGAMTLHSEKLGQPLHKVAFGPQDKQLATGDAAGVIRLHSAGGEGIVQATRGAHAAPITGLAYHADGKQLVTSGLDGLVKLWNLPLVAPHSLADHPEGATSLAFINADTLATGLPDGTIQLRKSPAFAEVTGELKGLGEPATAISASPDSKLIGAGTATGRVNFWLAENSQPAHSIAGHEGAVHAVAFHPKSPQAATAGADGTVRIWNLPQAPRELIKLAAPLHAAATSADGKQLVAGGDDKVVYLSTLGKPPKPPAKLAGHTSPVQSAAFRPDGKQFATGDESGDVRFWNAADGAPQFSLGAHTGSVSSLSLHAQNGLVATGGADGAVKMWQVPTAALTPLGKHDTAATTVAVTADSKMAVTGGTDKTLRFFDLATNKQNRSIALPESVAAMALTPNNQLVAAAGDAGTVRLFQTTDGAAVGSVGHGSAVKGVAFAPNNTQLATVGDDRVIRVWNLPVAAREMADHRGAVTVAALSPNGQLVASGGADKTVKIWNFANGKVSWSLGHNGAVSAVAWRADNAQVASTDGNNARIWNAADGKQIAQLTGHSAPVTGVAFGAGGVIVTGSADKTIRYWTVAEGKAVLTQTLAAHDQPLTALAALPDGSKIISAGADGRVRTWNVADAKRGLDVNHGSPVTCLSVSADGKLVAVAGKDNSLKIYQTADGKLTATITGLTTPASSVAFSRDNLKLAAASEDGLVRVWDIAGNLLESLETEQAASVAFAADHLHLVVGQRDNKIRIPRLSLVKRIAAAAGKQPLTCVAYTPDSASLVVGDGENNVKLYGVAQGNEVRTFAGNTAAVHGVAVSGDKVYSAGADKTVRIWTLANGAAVTTLEHPAPVRGLSVRPDGLRLVSGCDDGIMRTWDVASSQTVQRWQNESLDVALMANNDSIISVGKDGAVRRDAVLDKAFIPAAHAGGVSGLAFTPNGTNLVTCGADKTVKVFDMTGKQVRQLTDCPMPLTCLAVRGDSLQIAAAGEDKQLYFWTLSNGTLERKVMLPEAVASLAYSRDNTRLIAGSADGQLHVYNPLDGRLWESVAAGAPVHSVALTADNAGVVVCGADNRASIHQMSLVRLLAGHTGAVNGLAFSPDGAALVSAGADKSVRHWNTTNGTQVRSLAHTDAVTGVAVTPDGTHIISASADKSLRTWALANGAQATSITLESPVRKLAVSNDATRAATVGDDFIVRVWDLASGRELERFTGHEAAVGSLTMSADGKTVVSSSADKSVRAWSVGVERLIVADAAKIHDMTLTPDGKHIVTAGEDKFVKLWDLTGKMVRQFAGAAAPVRSVAVRADGTQIAAGGDPALGQVNVYVWNTADAKLLRTIQTPAGVSDVTFSGDHKLAVAGADKHLRVYSPDDGLVRQDWTAAAVLNDVKFAPDHTTLVTAGADNNSHVFHYSLLEFLTGHTGAVTGVAFTPDGKRLVTCGADKTVRLWNREDGKLICQFAGNTAAVNRLAISRDGKGLVTAGEDKIVRVWDVPAVDAKPAAQIQPSAMFTHPAIVRAVSISADGGIVAAAGDDNLVRLWDVATKTERERLPGHTSAIHAVSLSADGRTLISGAADNTARQFYPVVLAATKTHEGEILDVALNGEGTTAITSGADKLVKLWDISANSQIVPSKVAPQLAGATAVVKSVGASTDGKYFAAGGDDTHVRLWSAADRKSVAVVKTPAAITSIAIAADGRTIVAGGADKIIRNYGLFQNEDETWQLKLVHETHGHTEAVASVALAGAGPTMVSVGGDSTLKRWVAASAYPRTTFSEHAGPVYGLAWRGDGRLLASAAGDKTIRVWDTLDGKLRFTCNGHERSVNGVAFHPSGNELVSCSSDQTLRLWSSELPPDKPAEGAEAAEPPAEEKPAPGDELAVIQKEIEGGLYAVTYSRDGNALLAGGTAKAWRQWNRGGEPPRQLVRSLAMHNHAIYRILPNPSGSRIATLDYSGKLCVWNASDGGLLFHQQLPTTAGYDITYAPNAQEIIAATRDSRAIRVLIPSYAR